MRCRNQGYPVVWNQVPGVSDDLLRKRVFAQAPFRGVVPRSMQCAHCIVYELNRRRPRLFLLRTLVFLMVKHAGAAEPFLPQALITGGDQRETIQVVPP